MTQQFDAADTLAFFEELGLLTTDREGYVYPYSRQAASVLEDVYKRQAQKSVLSAVSGEHLS